MAKSDRKRLIVILGMHRSGTSAITRGLRVIGVDLGDRLMPPIESINAKGFWEDIDLNALNIEMLNALGSDWHHLAPIEPGDMEVLRKRGYFLRAVETLRQKIGRAPNFGFKDPRVAKLLPFWKEVFAYCQIDTSYVIAVRHPISVARSLSRRDSLDAEKSYLLWLEHVITSLSGTAGERRVLVDYDLLMQSPDRELNRIARQLDLEIDPVELQHYMTAFLDQGLRHTLYDLNDLLLEDACHPLVFDIYAALLNVASDKSRIDDTALQNQIAQWACEFERLKSPLVLADRLYTRKTEFEQLQGSFDALARERDEQVAQLNQTIESLIIDRDSQKAGFEQLQLSLEALAHGRDEQVAQLNQTIESLIIDRDSQRAGIEQLQLSFETLARERDEQVSQLQLSLEALTRERNEQVSQLNRTVESLIVDLDSRKAGLEQLQSSLEVLARERDEQVAQLGWIIAERDGQIGSLQTELSAVYGSKSWRLTSPLRGLVRGGQKITGYARSKRHHAVPANLNPDREIGAAVEVRKAAVTEHDDPRFRILLVSHYSPTRAHAGGLRILDIYALIRQQCPNVQLDLLTHHRPAIDWSLDDAHRIFHNVYLSPAENLTPEGLAAMRGSPLSYDVIDLQFHQTGYQMDAFRRIGGKIIFTPMESLAKVLFIDIRTRSLVKSSLHLFKTATSLRLAAEEVGFVSQADEVVCVSRADAAFLRAVTSSRHIRGVDTGVSHFEFAEALAPGFTVTGAADRPCRVLYVAYFGSETNVAALLWYLEHVHPLIKARVSGYVLTVVGRGDLSHFDKYRDSSTEFVGEVAALAPHIQQARVGIAPALGGSGFRGKVNQYAVLGVPCVVSPIAFKGLTYQDGVSIFIAETPEIFADRCIRLLTDTDLNDRMGQAARKQCLERYSWQSKWGTIRKIYKLEGVA